MCARGGAPPCRKALQASENLLKTQSCQCAEAAVRAHVARPCLTQAMPMRSPASAAPCRCTMTGAAYTHALTLDVLIQHSKHSDDLDTP